MAKFWGTKWSQIDFSKSDYIMLYSNIKGLATRPPFPLEGGRHQAIVLGAGIRSNP